jgi:catechol 2,3-dioxygenase-like lactoylglutathione lyase family enzyme
MPIIPTVRCSNLGVSVNFYTKLLDFVLTEATVDLDDPGFCALTRDGSWLYLSSHSGDGEFGQAIVVTVSDLDSLFLALKSRGLASPKDRISPVHEAPTNQTWGTRELYVDDPDGNTVRFVQIE